MMHAMLTSVRAKLMLPEVSMEGSSRLSKSVIALPNAAYALHTAPAAAPAIAHPVTHV